MKRRVIPAYRRRMAIAGILLLSLPACDFSASEELLSSDAYLAGSQGRPERGQMLLFAYGCGACHDIPDVDGNPGNIGPPLANWKHRKYIAGQLPNQPETLVHWIMRPQEVEPGTAMPDLGVTEREAVDMAAYLYSL